MNCNTTHYRANSSSVPGDPTTSRHLGDNASISLTHAEAEGLSALARKSGATLFMVLFAAYNVMLHRYSGQRTVLVGTPVRARNRPEIENLIGPFVNAVVLRTGFEPDMRFTDLLAQVRDTTLDAFSHEDMPLERLGARPPIVRAFFSFQDARTRPPALGKAQISQIHVEPKAAANDLMLWTMETRGDLLAVINYSSELFDPQTIARFLEGFRELLRGVLRSPETRVSALPVAAPSEAEALRQWGAPEGVSAPALSAQVEHWAHHAPDRVAISDGERALSYVELWRRANALAAVLPRGGRVGVLASSSVERGVALVAADLCGVSLVALEPGAPAPRTAAVCTALPLEAALVSDPSARPVGVPETLPLLALSAGDAQSQSRSAPPPDAALVWLVRFDAESQATALPVSRAALATGARELANALGVQPGQSVLGLSGAAAEFAPYEMALPLMAGATLLQPAPNARIDRLSAHAHFDLALGPASAFGKLTAGERSLCEVCAVTGEATPPLAAMLLGQGKRLYRVAAFPEANLAPFAQQLGEAHEAARIGRPLFPARAAVRDLDGSPAPIGVPGALVLHSALRVAGGPDAPLATARRARFMRDGSLELVSDLTREVDVAGVWICLEEIATLLARHPSIAAARVLASHSKTGVPRLDAYLSLRPAKQFTETELRRHLQQSLPAYALPQAFIEVDDPAILSDASALARLRSAVGSEADYVAPRTAAERLIAEHWSKALQLGKVSVHDNFFTLGGHSLLCFEVINAIEKSSGRRLGPRLLLLGTLEQVAVEFERAAPTSTPSSQPSAAAAAPQDPKRDTALTSRLLQRLKGLVR